MNTKNVLVSFLAIAFVLFLVAMTSASSQYKITTVKVDGVKIVDDGFLTGKTASITAGETVTVEVEFAADFNECDPDDEECLQDFDVTVEAQIDTGKKKVTEVSKSMYMEDGDSRKVVLDLLIPNELKDDLSDTVSLDVEVDGKQYDSDTESYDLKVERTLYEADIKSVSVSGKVNAGDNFPVDIVVKNTGAADLDDLYVTATISALGLQKSAYFGDLVAMEDKYSDDNDNTDTVSGRLYLDMPYDVAAGVYTLEVKAVNDDTVSTITKQIVVENDFTNNVIATTLSKSASENEQVIYNLLIVNPTDKLKVYRVVPESSGSLTASANPSVIAIPAGSSQQVEITASASEAGQYNFNVNVISGEATVNTVGFSLNVAQTSVTNPVVILTIVLAIIFLVLLVVLIVLLSKKPEKSEEFGESYY